MLGDENSNMREEGEEVNGGWPLSQARQGGEDQWHTIHKVKATQIMLVGNVKGPQKRLTQ